MSEDTRITFNLDRKLSDHIGRVAKDMGFGQKSVLIRVAIVEYLENHGQSFSAEEASEGQG